MDAHRPTSNLAADVRAGAHFYMAHRMREYPHPNDPDITMAEHAPNDPDCPGCKAEAALDALVARITDLEAQLQNAERYATHDPGVDWPSDKHDDPMDAIMATFVENWDFHACDYLVGEFDEEMRAIPARVVDDIIEAQKVARRALAAEGPA